MNIQRLPKVLTLCSPGRSIAGLLQGIPLLVLCTAQGHKKHRPPSKKKRKSFIYHKECWFSVSFFVKTVHIKIGRVKSFLYILSNKLLEFS